jgi:nucleoside phosphorylase
MREMLPSVLSRVNEVPVRGWRIMVAGRRGRAQVAVLTIIDEEFEAARRVFGASEHIPRTQCFAAPPISEGYFDWVMMRSPGRSNEPAGEAIQDLIEEFRPAFILLVGIAGGIGGRGELGLGDVVVPDYIHYGAYRKLVEGKSLARYLPFDHPSLYFHGYHVDPARHIGTWMKHVTASRPLAGDPRVRIGSLVAGEKLFGDPTNEEQQQMVAFYDDALAVDMESMGVARAIFKSRRSVDYNPQFGVIRGISDLVGQESNNEVRQQWKGYAAEVAAAFAWTVVQGLLDAVTDRHRTDAPNA